MVNQSSGVKTPESIGHMIGEFLREAAVLILVFGLLDPLIFGDKLPLDWLQWLGVILVCSAILLLFGVLIELHWS